MSSIYLPSSFGWRKRDPVRCRIVSVLCFCSHLFTHVSCVGNAGEALEELEEVEELEAEMTLEDIESAENGSSAGKDMLLNAAKNGEELLESLLFGGGGGDEDGSITPSGITSGWSAKPAGGRHSQGVSGAGKGDKASKKKEHHHVGLVERAKVAVFESIQRYGFWAILAAASIPNPLFDLAGLTCGHFGISVGTLDG